MFKRYSSFLKNNCLVYNPNFSTLGSPGTSCLEYFSLFKVPDLDSFIIVFDSSLDNFRNDFPQAITLIP